MKANDPHSHLPLGPATLQILLALSGEDLHGYGIMLEVRRQTEGLYELGPGTLYDNLQRLEEQGWVRQLATRPKGGDARRKYFRLTAAGKRTLAAEIDRLEGVVKEARLRERGLRGSET